jgi:hypothetical protein
MREPGNKFAEKNKKQRESWNDWFGNCFQFQAERENLAGSRPIPNPCHR